MSKITKATFKSFVKKNSGNLYVNVLQSFDPTIDGVTRDNKGFCAAIPDLSFSDFEETLGIKGILLVWGSRNYFTPHNAAGFRGIEVSNACSYFIVAIKDVTIQ